MRRRFNTIWIWLVLAVGLGFYFWVDRDSKSTAEKIVRDITEEPAVNGQTATNQKENESREGSSSKRHPTTAQDQLEITSEGDFRKSYGAEWNFSYNSHKRITRVFGGQINGVGNDWEKVYPFGQSIAGLFGVPSEDLKSQRGEAGESARTEGFRIDQSHDGFDVYQGNMVLFIKKEDGTLFMINNNLKSIGVYEREIKVSVAEAERYLRSLLQDKDLREVTSNPRPILYSDGAESLLGWLFTVKVGREKFVREIVMSTQEPKILSQLDFTSF